VMDISFKTKKIEKLPSNPKNLHGAYPEPAATIMARLDLLAKADTLAEVPVDRTTSRKFVRPASATLKR